MCSVQGQMHSTYLPTAVPSLSVTSMVKGTANSMSVLRTSTWFSPSGTEYTAGAKNTLNSLSNMEKRKRKYAELHVRHVHFSCVHDIWPNIAWVHWPVFSWLCMWLHVWCTGDFFKETSRSVANLVCTHGAIQSVPGGRLFCTIQVLHENHETITWQWHHSVEARNLWLQCGTREWATCSKDGI